MTVKVDVFSGFLGAGKTQLIKKLIEEGYYRENIAIIENEFGEVSIDASILKRTNTLVREINAGCICCQVTGDFKDSILDVIENCSIDRLLIEPTGIAKLSDIKKIFEDENLKDIAVIEKSITVVDAEKFNIYIYNFKSFFENQIKNADIIILSRTQNISAQDVNEINENIKKMSKDAIIISKDWKITKSEELIPKKIIAKQREIKKDKIIFKRESLKKILVNKNGNEEKFETFSIKLDKIVSKDELLSKFNFIKNSIEFGEIVRAKGIVETNNGKEKFDYTLSEINIEKIIYKGESIISFIGINLDKDKIKKIFL